MKRVCIINSSYEYDEFFHGLGFDLRPTEAIGKEALDLLVFTGGADISPHMYGHPQHDFTHADVRRDRIEKLVFGLAVANKIPMVGICRGGQFLHVMNGGVMYQHIYNNEHLGEHNASVVGQSRLWTVSSTHHQMMKPGDKGEVVLADHRVVTVADYSPQLRVFFREEVRGTEGIFYPETNCLCFQPHPEFGGYDETDDCPTLFRNLLNETLKLEV